MLINMENLDHEITLEQPENDASTGLWLTDRLLEQLRNASRIGRPLIVLCILVGISSALISVFPLFWYLQHLQGDFYLLEGDNAYRVFNLLATALIIYCFAQAMIQGFKAWKHLRFSETDDEALLEGSERLAKMFRWLSLWGGGYFGFLVLVKVWSAFIG